MSQTPIRLADYDPEWPERFEQEAARIREAAGDHLLALEHIGSTAVPGLAAKPVVDMLGGTETLADADACVGPLEAIGYEYVPELEAELPERRYFRRTADGRHTHHLHVVEVGSEFFERHRDFRDYLRDHPEAAARYEALKRELAAEHRHDVAAYTEGKSDFVAEIEARAGDRET